MTNIIQKDGQDEPFDKHQRFNLRKLNMAPLNRDHYRAADMVVSEANS